MSQPESIDEPATPGSRRPALLRWVLLGLVVVAFALAVGRRWGDVVLSVQALDPLLLLAGVALVALGSLGTWWSWREVLAELGSRLPRPASARMFFVGQLGKYVPGAVWPVLVQIRLGRELGVPRARIAISFAVTVALGVASGLVIGLLGLPALLAGDSGRYAWLFLLLPVALLALHPRVVNWLLSRLFQLTRRRSTAPSLSGRAIGRGVVGQLGFWFGYGLQVWLLAVGLGADPARSAPVAIGAAALAYSVGPLLVVLPAGAGVREAVMTVGLTTVLPIADAVAVALVSRVVVMAADGLLAAGAQIAARGIRRGGGRPGT